LYQIISLKSKRKSDLIETAPWWLVLLHEPLR